METKMICLECGSRCGARCGAMLEPGQTCETNFHQMLFWENEFPEYGEKVHHLVVLCYHLQHPSLFSPQGLSYGRELLRKFVQDGIDPQEMRLRLGNAVDSSGRRWKIRGTQGQTAAYSRPIRWAMTSADIIAGGHENYCKNVGQWAETILLDLEKQA